MNWLDRCRGWLGLPPYRRGPYLQHLRPDGLTVCWRTGDDSPPRLWLRGEDEALARAVEGVRAGKERRVSLGGLTPGARYRYRLSEDDPERCFRFPDADAERFTFCAVGDHGRSCAAQRRVIAALRTREPAFVLSLGDVCYPRLSDWRLDVNLFRPFADLMAETVLWPAIGNHDFQHVAARPLLAAVEVPGNGPPGLPRGRGGYAFDFGAAHFAVINSAERRELVTDVLPWLDADLESAAAPWKIVVSHHPPYSSGRYGNHRRLIERMVPLLQARGVQLVLSGHDHAYERLRPAPGPTYVVCGTGGGRLYKRRGKRAGALARINRTHGALEATVAPASLTLRFLDVAGRILDEMELRPSAADEDGEGGIRTRDRANNPMTV